MSTPASMALVDQDAALGRAVQYRAYCGQDVRDHMFGPRSPLRPGPVGGEADAVAARPAGGFDVRAEVTDYHALRRGRAHPSAHPEDQPRHVAQPVNTSAMKRGAAGRGLSPLNPRRNFGTDEDKTRFGEEPRHAQLAACVA
ncbi:hypothetical protein ABZY05_39375 [Streptomyces canus]|uniref:hypothetical protein n=1 Tax=Streptomyces canus TaxID=58343 RepID=UPI0033ABAE28